MTAELRAGPVPAADATGQLARPTLAQQTEDVTMRLHGAGATAPTGTAETPIVDRFLYVRCQAIVGSTSDIRRNIIGERVLGLPQEHAADQDLSSSKLPR